MRRKIRRLEDAHFNFGVLALWGVLFALVLWEQQMSLALAACLLVCGYLLRHPLRGLDSGRILWGCCGVAAGTMMQLLAQRPFWSLTAFVIWAASSGYLLAAFVRCPIGRRNYIGLVLTAAGMIVSLFLPLPKSVIWSIQLTLLLMASAFVLIFCPSALLRAGLLVLSRTIYRIRVGSEGNRIPNSGGLLLVANHVSFLDFAFILAATPRPVHFMVVSRIYRLPILRWYFRRMGFLEVPSVSHPKAVQKFLATIRTLLAAGRAVAVYPEGGISSTGVTGAFKRGIQDMLPNDERVQIIPLHLGLYWGRLLAWDENKLHYIAPLRWPIPVSVTVGEKLSPSSNRYELWQRICEIGAEAEMLHQYWERPLHYAFAEMVQKARHRVVFSDYEGEGIPNWEMLVRSLLLSKQVRKLAPESENIGVFLPGSTAAAASALGILFADKTPAFLNFTAGPESLNAAIQQADLRCILTSRRFLVKLKMEPLPGMVMLEDVAKKITRFDKVLTTFSAWWRTPRSLARHYSPKSWNDLDRTGAILFTSGSSGVPKGVMLSHHNVNSDIFSFWRVISWSKERDMLIGQLPLFHAFGLTVSFWFPAMSATRVCYYPNPLDAAKICRIIRDRQVTLLVATPTFLQSYCRKAQAGDFDSLRLVITGAEKLRQDVVDQLEEITHLTVTEGYGCTELSPIAAVNLARSCFALGRKVGKSGSIGQPLPGIAARTVSPESGEMLSADEIGLLEIKGPNVMKGYLNAPELTARVMHDGWYSTGDLARIDADGYIFLTGRQSRFSKVAGEMVPHEMVESRLAELYPGENRHFAVTGCKDAKRGERLLIFYNLPELDLSEAVRKMRESGLPNLWIPKLDDFIKVTEIPSLASGKLDLQKLNQLALNWQQQQKA